MSEPRLHTDGIRAAQSQWASLGIEERAETLRAIGDTFAGRAETLIARVCEETQKSQVDAWFADLIPNIDLFTYWAGPGKKHLREESVGLSSLKFPGKVAKLRYEPKGIVGLITPWNYPVALPLRSLIPALLAGNAVLFKPSEVTPSTGDLLASIFNEYLPTGLLTVVHGAKDAGEAVVDASDHVIFIGSVETGRSVATRCAQSLKTVSLELGGKDAALVLADCDIGRTAQGILWGAMSNSGQNCASIERVYVEEEVYQPFLDALTSLAQGVTVHPVATSTQNKKVESHLEDAVARGGKLIGTYPGPVLVTDVPEDAAIVQDETFGPVCVVSSVPSAREGIRRSNQSRYGLTTSIWTKNEKRAMELAEEADTGVVSINNVALTGAMPFAPWSGRRESGSGVTNSHLAIREMVQSKFILYDSNKDPEVWWFPATDQALELARTTVAWLTAKPFSKIGKTFKVLGAMKARIKDQKEHLKKHS
jgi:acyl-CoA reductase-like NAD-dependent aldehyde dehydrogenase